MVLEVELLFILILILQRAKIDIKCGSIFTAECYGTNHSDYIDKSSYDES